MWIAFGGMLGSVIGIMIVHLAKEARGGDRLLLLAVLLSIVVGYTAVSWRWVREHRLPRR